MTDLKVHKRSAKSGAWVQINAKNIENMRPEIRQALEDIVKAFEVEGEQ